MNFSALKEYMTNWCREKCIRIIQKVFNKLNKLENSTNKVGQISRNITRV